MRGLLLIYCSLEWVNAIILITHQSNAEWHAMFTTQVTQKAKKYHDGFLQLSICVSQRKQVGSHYFCISCFWIFLFCAVDYDMPPLGILVISWQMSCRHVLYFLSFTWIADGSLPYYS